ncbi:unnamed protein product [Thlaspi arvense]|uniref:NAC domain-containing protein n=1 Tax=Thlaspi arvense TaxID=13288 RepID=A0AAU9REW9_THLAR|nr:unnamed protein product [Thlaspi arvense]
MARPAGSRFLPTDLWLVTGCLHEKVEKNKKGCLDDKVENNKKGFIKTMKVYEDEPWRLDHDLNPLFKRDEWYYFVPRTKRGGKTANRSVPRNGESEGGTWKATTKKNIVDGNGTLVGYKRDFVYNKTVEGKPVKTDWHMSEYSLHEADADAEFQDLVLCWIGDLEKMDSRFKFVPREVENNNNILLPNQEQEDDADFANHIEMMMLEEGEPSDVNQQRQEQEQDMPNPLLPPFQSNDNQEQCLWDDFGFDGADDDDTISHDLMMRIMYEENDVTQQQQREEDRLQLLQRIPEAQAQDSGSSGSQFMAQR